MNLRPWVLVSLSTLVACGDDSGSGPDAPVVPATITISGQADSIGLGGRRAEPGIVVTAHREGDDATVVAMATSGVDGKFSMMVETGGVALDGYLLAKGGNFKDTYLYPPTALADSTDQATCLMLTQGIFDTVATFARAEQDPGMGWIGVLVVDAQDMPIAGATISDSPAGMVRYNGTEGRPDPEAMMTPADGIAYIFNVPAGTVTVSAAKSGLTFAPNDLNARADQVTLTLLQ